MRGLHLPLLIVPAVAARLLHSIPEDTHAYPKFRVAFLNSLPLFKDTAHLWHSQGLTRGLSEFLDQPDNNGPPREIDGVIAPLVSDLAPPPAVNYTLEYMKMGPKDAYLCLIPNPPPHKAPAEKDDEPEIEATPAQSWSLLQPLTGTCLFHKQGWFTYSYCHNDQIRQFKEAAQTLSPAGGHRPPEEDPEWEAYTLGKAPKPGVDLTVAEQNVQGASIELAQGGGQRYLVQRWGDGTLCDKTGRNREVEVQFHCSMTMTDTILFVKETKTCSYVLVIHTPRLCGEPGFKSPSDKGEESEIRCREIVDIPPTLVTDATTGIPDVDYPIKLSPKRPVLPPPVKEPSVKKEKKDYGEIFRQTLESFMKNSDVVLGDISADGEDIMFEVVDAGEITQETVDKLSDMLRNAGLDVRAEKVVMGDRSERERAKRKQQSKDAARDEL